MLNPYEPPRGESASYETDAVPSRGSLTSLIQSFLDSEITAFQFDELLDPFRDSDDPIVQHVAEAVWYHYDDCDDHLVCLSKQEWDYFQRLLLVLNSNCRLEKKTDREWSTRQVIAALALSVFACCAQQTGWGDHLFVLAMPFGVISIALSLWHVNDESHVNPYWPIIFPFASLADLSTAYRCSSFRKTRYPKQLSGRTIRSPMMSAFWRLHAYTMWLIFSPLPLACQMLPETRTVTRVLAA